MLAEGGAYVNNRRVTDPAAVPDRSELLAGRWLLLRRGKRSLAVAEIGAMRLAFLTGALAAGLAVAALSGCRHLDRHAAERLDRAVERGDLARDARRHRDASATYIAEGIVDRRTRRGSGRPASPGRTGSTEPVATRDIAALPGAQATELGPISRYQGRR